MGAAIPDLNRLRWQCRRGMLELDEMLLNYLEHCFVEASTEQQKAFRAILTVEDPQLHHWLFGGGEPPCEMRGIVAAIRRCEDG